MCIMHVRISACMDPMFHNNTFQVAHALLKQDCLIVHVHPVVTKTVNRHTSRRMKKRFMQV